jgi:hypothetical protein
VVDVIANSQRALSPLEVFDLARPQHAGLGLVTVYRTLEKLEELGLIQRVHQPQGCQAFIAAFTGPPAPDPVLANAATVQFFDGDNLEALIRDPPADRLLRARPLAAAVWPVRSLPGGGMNRRASNPAAPGLPASLSMLILFFAATAAARLPQPQADRLTGHRHHFDCRRCRPTGRRRPRRDHRAGAARM